MAGYDYENAMIGTSVWGRSCTNNPPDAWMTNFVLLVAASGLTPGIAYNLYEYEFSSVEGEGAGAALAVPVRDFNANARLATHTTTYSSWFDLSTECHYHL